MKTQKQIVMSIAWEIRREAAAEQEVRVAEIHFGECLKAAWAMVKKYGHELIAKVEALRMTARSMMFTQVIQSVEEKIWDMKEISDRFLAEVDRRYNAI